MKNQLRKMDCALQRAKSKLMEKREGSDQLISSSSCLSLSQWQQVKQCI